jgi:hypothetical protein
VNDIRFGEKLCLYRFGKKCLVLSQTQFYAFMLLRQRIEFYSLELKSYSKI